ncbi:MAG: hypothetical protein H0U86_00010 [Chloroflexi bacterium]|nr:hypothetical protein [Chloroflexota bacterium]
MLAAARVTLKLHRFEVGVAVVAAIAAAVLGLIIAVRIDALGVSQDCLDRVRASQDGFSAGEDCFSLVRAGSGILGESYLDGEGTVPLSIMGALPFLLGLLGGVPIVARELEARTASTAWSLNGSRVRWLARQVWPVGLVLGTAIVLAALAAMPVAEDFVAWGHGGESSLIGLHGPLAVVRAFGAFGIGLAVGALLGRTLSAFLVGVALTLAITFALGEGRATWLGSMEPQPIVTYSAETGEYNGIPGAVATSWGWLTPEGVLLLKEDARQLATQAGVPPADPDDVQDTPAAIWLQEHDYTEVSLGVTDEMALGWAPFDGLTFGVVGMVGFAGTIMLVNRRRPA